MLIDADALHHWMNHFYGYGSWSAKFWFVAHEESSGDSPEEVAEKLNYFKRAHLGQEPALCDLREIYKEITFRIEGPRAEKFQTFHDHRFGNDATLHGLWKNLIAFRHGYDGEICSDVLDYQRRKFASPTAKEAMLQLYPLPAHHHAWYYGWLEMPQFPFLKTRALYQDHLFSTRIKTILAKIEEHEPAVVLMYGMENINALKAAVEDTFQKTKFKMVKGVKQRLPQYHRANVSNTIILITTQVPTLRHNRAETGFDWEELGRLL